MPVAAYHSQKMDPARCSCFLEDIVDVSSNRGEGDVHLIGNLLVAEAVTDVLDHFGFPLRDLVGGDKRLADLSILDQGSGIGEIAQKDGDNDEAPEGEVDVVEGDMQSLYGGKPVGDYIEEGGGGAKMRVSTPSRFKRIDMSSCASRAAAR